MRIFLSYAHDAERLESQRKRGHSVRAVAVELRIRGHEVFVDDDLPKGDEFRRTLQEKVDGCDLFVAFLSPGYVERGSYCLTELGYAEKRWPNPAGHVLPIIQRRVDLTLVPNFAKALSIVETKGDFTTEVADVIDPRRRPAPATRRPCLLQALCWAVGAAIILWMALIAYYEADGGSELPSVTKLGFAGLCFVFAALGSLGWCGLARLRPRRTQAASRAPTARRRF
ncbi:MAG TPA: toll/interleukin-1 receptor domain-containing protein [Candidatus Krumholzibacteria bacterium]